MSTMLIADDNPQLLHILKSVAQKEGFDVLLAEDGQQAIELFLTQKPHIIFIRCNDAKTRRLSSMSRNTKSI